MPVSVDDAIKVDGMVLYVVNHADESFVEAYYADNEMNSNVGRIPLSAIEHMHEPPNTETCSECKARVPEIISCPDGAEICQRCFDAGLH